MGMRRLSRSSSQVAEQRWEETNVHGVGHFVTLTERLVGVGSRSRSLAFQHAPCLWRSEYFIVLLNQRVIGQTEQGTLKSWKGKVDRPCWQIGRTMEID